MSVKAARWMIVIVTRCARMQWAHISVSVGQGSLVMGRRAVFLKASNETCACHMPLLLSMIVLTNRTSCFVYFFFILHIPAAFFSEQEKPKVCHLHFPSLSTKIDLHAPWRFQIPSLFFSSTFEEAASHFAHASWKVSCNIFNFVVPLWIIVISLVFFYLSKLLFFMFHLIPK